MPAPTEIARLQQDRNQALDTARRERAKKKEAEQEAKDAKKTGRALMRQQAAEYGILFAMSGLALTTGLIVGGQLSRVTAGWGRWAERISLATGFLVLMVARTRWQYLLAFMLLGAGGVQVSDFSRKRDLIPGDRDWENTLPTTGEGEVRRVTVVKGPAS